MELSVSAVKLQDEWHAIGILRDISERREIEETIRRSNELLEKFFASIHIMLAYMDKDFNFIRVNEAYAKANQKDISYFAGKNHFALFPNEENEAIFRSVVEKGTPYITYAKPFANPEHPEGGSTYWDWALQPIKDAQGQVEGLVLSLLDVTEKHKLEEEKQKIHAEEERLKTLHTVSMTYAHHILNTITPVQGYAELIQKSAGADDPRYKWSQSIIDKAKEVTEIIKKLKEIESFSVTELGGVEILEIEKTEK